MRVAFTMTTRCKHLFWVLIVFDCLTPLAAAAPKKPTTTTPTTAPVGSVENPKRITSADRGPDIDPAEFVSTKFSGIPIFRTFRGFMSGSYAIADVWVYAANDDPAMYDAEVAYPWPEFYTPTWQEVFDHVARQMRCTWSWNPRNRQFKFERTDAEPFFGVTLADGWRREDRGLYVWHAPKDQNFGMDIYYYGHFTVSADDDEDREVIKKARAYFAVGQVSNWPDPPTEQEMSTVQVAGVEALYLKIDTPRPGGVWRQWSFLVDGHAFVIVSAMPKDREAQLLPAVEKMVASFQVHAPPPSTSPTTTRPQARPQK
jgi:hypothetical protein